MRKALCLAAAFCGCLVLLFWGVFALVGKTIPPYLDSAGDLNYTEKMAGRYLVQQSAAREDNLILFGSSELRTTEVSTHPASFFAGKRAGFQVNLVGRGSCQSLVHALSIAASGDALRGKKVVLITSPQSYIPAGIAPDLFMANFSPQQYLELLAADDLSDEVKQNISARVGTLLGEYEAMSNTAPPDKGIQALAAHTAQPTILSTAKHAVLVPYYAFGRYLYDLKDKATASKLLKSLHPGTQPVSPSPINWEEEEAAAATEAQRMTGNNNFGMLDDYYTTYIGSRLERQRGRDIDLDYAVSQEYNDLRILLEVCRQKGIEPLFVHVPLHGSWSDYTGFTAKRRQQYYNNVLAIAQEYGVETLDLTPYEYDQYFLCDVMHLGWKGWLAVDKALIEYYYKP